MPDPVDPAVPAIPEPASFNWDSDDNPYKKSFNDYRVEADRRATKLSSYETLLEDLRSPDLDRQRSAAQELGVELVEDEPVYNDPSEVLAAQLEATNQRQAALEARLAERDRSDAEARLTSRITDALDAMGLEEDDADFVLARAVALGADDTGLPKLKEAYEVLQRRDEAAMKRWAASKRAPRGIAPGSTATETKDVADMTDSERIEYAVSRLEGSY